MTNWAYFNIMPSNLDDLQQKTLLRYLAQFITEHKLKKMEEVLSWRTRRITVAIEDVFKSHNASAVIRNCDAAGIQDLHIIENYQKYKVNPYVTRGSSQWINLIRYNLPEVDNTKKCYEALRSQGYIIVATVPGKDGKTLEKFEINQKIALILGNEFNGLSSWAIENADLKLSLPMYGFTDSYNISVTAALCLHHLVQKLHQSNIAWGLSEDEKEKIRLAWYKKAVKRSDLHAKLFLGKEEKGNQARLIK
jgi:tRNA (guanosine-2'-O-)-methyltransferase